MNRKLFLAGTFSLPLSGIAFADDNLPSIALSLKEPFDRRLEIARTKLERGQYLDNVIKLLESCIKEQPDRYDLYLELSCANAGRAYFLSKSEIEQTLMNKKLLLTEKPKDIKVKPVRTADNNSIYKYSREEVVKLINIYCDKSIHNLSIARKIISRSNIHEDLIKFNTYSMWIYGVLSRNPKLISNNCLPKEINWLYISNFATNNINLESENSFHLLVKSDLLDFIGDFKDIIDYKNLCMSTNITLDTNILAKSSELLSEYNKSAEKIDPITNLRIAILDENKMSFDIHNASRSDRSSARISEQLQSGLEKYKIFYESRKSDFLPCLMYATKLYLNGDQGKSSELLSGINYSKQPYIPSYRFHAPKSMLAFLPVRPLLPNDFRYISLAVTDKIRKLPTEDYESKFFPVLVNVIEITECLSSIKESEPYFSRIVDSVVKTNLMFLLALLHEQFLLPRVARLANFPGCHPVDLLGMKAWLSGIPRRVKTFNTRQRSKHSTR